MCPAPPRYSLPPRHVVSCKQISSLGQGTDTSEQCSCSAPSQVMLPPERAEGARQLRMLNLSIFPGQIRTLLHCIYTAGLCSCVQAAVERVLRLWRGSGTHASSLDNTELSSTEQKPGVTGRSDAFRAKSHLQAVPSAHSALQAALYQTTKADDDCRTYAELGFTHSSYSTILGVLVQPLWHRSSSQPAQHSISEPAGSRACVRQGSTRWALAQGQPLLSLAFS